METKLLLIFCTLLFCTPIQAQKTIRFQVWTQAETLPNSEKTYEHPAEYVIENLHKTSAFLLTGLLYGWNFSYTPSDLARGVSEYFHFESFRTIETTDSRMIFEQPFFQDNKLYAWVSYKCTPEQEIWLQSRNSIVIPKAGGSGKGRILDEFDGIQRAYETALKNAVRHYVQKNTKNKPKEINGHALLSEVPGLRIDSGNYEINASFYLDITEILPYKAF